MPTTKLGKCTWGWPEVSAVLSGVFGTVSAGAARERLRHALQGLGYGALLFLADSASLGLRLALEEMRSQRAQKSVVVVPSYCCPSVPRTVRDLGLSLRAAPVSSDLNLDLDALELTNDVLAVVAPHMYALPLDMSRLRAATDAAGAFLIDDAAHALSPPLGSRGDVGLLSFNQSKTLTGGSPRGGGALLVTNDALQQGVARRYDQLAEGRSIARSYIWFALRYGIEVTPHALTEYIHPVDSSVAWILRAKHDGRERMSAAAALAVHAQMARLSEIQTARTKLVEWYLAAVQRVGNLQFAQATSPRYLSRMLVRWQHGPNAADVRQRLARRGFATRLSYPMWTADDDPTASDIRRIRATHLELAGSPRLTRDEAEELVHAVADCVSSA
jgi:dTDP-4-amino-4,6-dideoxygalactose transaminase